MEYDIEENVKKVEKIYQFTIKNGSKINKGKIEIRNSAEKQKSQQLKDLKKTITNGEEHLCFNCQNAWPSKCPKIRDLEKKNIEQYPFIEKGYEIIVAGDEISKSESKGITIKEFRKLEHLIVTDCTNFKHDKDKKYDTTEHCKVKKLTK